MSSRGEYINLEGQTGPVISYLSPVQGPDQYSHSPFRDQKRIRRAQGDLRSHYSPSIVRWSKLSILSRKRISETRKQCEQTNRYLKEIVIQKVLLNPALFQGLKRPQGLHAPTVTSFPLSGWNMFRVRSLSATWTQEPRWWGEKHTGKPGQLSLSDSSVVTGKAISLLGCRFYIYEFGVTSPVRSFLVFAFNALGTPLFSLVGPGVLF